jgi:HPt (histidine-containing phosphotransfer) domain-containing protein
MTDSTSDSGELTALEKELLNQLIQLIDTTRVDAPDDVSVSNLTKAKEPTIVDARDAICAVIIDLAITDEPMPIEERAALLESLTSSLQSIDSIIAAGDDGPGAAEEDVCAELNRRLNASREAVHEAARAAGNAQDRLARLRTVARDVTSSAEALGADRFEGDIWAGLRAALEDLAMELAR